MIWLLVSNPATTVSGSVNFVSAVSRRLVARSPSGVRSSGSNHDTRAFSCSVSITTRSPMCPPPNSAMRKAGCVKHSSSTVTLPPQHWSAAAASGKCSMCWPLVDFPRSSLALAITRCSSWPPPSVSCSAVGVITILVPAGRGADPFVAITVAIT